MSANLDRNYVADLLPLYALGALEPAEMGAIAAYLQQHPDLQAQLAALDEVLLQLAQSAPTTPLPGAARERLLARVQADQQAAEQRRAAEPTDAGRVETALAKSPAPSPHPLFPWRRRRTPQAPVTPTPHTPVRRTAGSARLGWITATAALLLGLVLLNRMMILNQTVARLTTEVTTLRQQNQLLEEQWRGARDQLALFLNAERSVALAGTELAPAAQGAFYLNNDDGVVVLRGLEPLPPDRAYQLWLVPPGGTPTAVALLPVGATDLYTQTVTVPPALRDFAIVDVSIEQAGGSPVITKETIVLRGVLN